MAAHHRQHQLQWKWGCLSFALCCLLLGSIFIQKNTKQATAVMYQPLNRDLQVTGQQWHQLAQEFTAKGFDTLVVQWNQYGTEEFGGSSGWLAKNIELFMNEGVDIWLGLYSDPDYFRRIHTSRENQKEYLEEYLKNAHTSYKAWGHWIERHSTNVKGIYLPFEISDYDFDTTEKREQLNALLSGITDTYTERLMISVYLSGQLSSEDTAKWLKSIRSQGIEVYVQDGRGTQLINDDHWADYNNEFGCNIGVIKEAFIQTGQNPFIAKPIDKDGLLKLRLDDRCNEKILFSLRYLPIPNNPLALLD
ncbi:DUF4434 domain-containing protein [Vibrio sp. 10N.261.55.A7]|uniref:DUF4434 domain-containing protein n=1 Tax=Vibrio sp. 10N.261.55.A7 TaxID=1880851 RepID=UPI000C856B95|nr:DUF4434 domain-containing protein [Vibrio sp. 10N.261.55.A7]